MKLRKLLRSTCLAGFVSLLSLSAYAQGAYVKLGGGYNFGIGSASTANVTRTHTFDPQTNTSKISERVQRVKLNYGKGLIGNAAFGYMFNSHFGAEVEVSYLAGGENNSRYQLTFNTDPDKPYIRKYNSYANMLLLQPALIASNKVTEKVELYGKFGVVVATGQIFTNAYILDYDQDRQERTIEAQYDGGLGFGLMAGLGFSYKLTEKCGIFSEIKMSNLSYSPKWYRLKKETINGEDITAFRQKDTELVNSYSTSYSGEPSVNIKEAFPFGSVGLNLGLKYTF
ncbi:outer membrane beta-barrel protein [Adhaeribacter terreus]|uniref:Outer membrane beta-barrel protein n=1 Tax=Adhaeribacter terreus TaxID=529703 RepID=A0ABW0EDA2_9BACT